MSDLKASVAETKRGFHVEGYEKIEYDFTFIDGIFDPRNEDLAQAYKKWGRCLAIMDLNIFNIYGKQMQEYFDHHQLGLKVHKTMIGEKAKSIETLLSIVDSMNEFGIIRKVRLKRRGERLKDVNNFEQEPVLVVGGGLVTDVAG
jgi:3-dehydroquinate synthase